MIVILLDETSDGDHLAGAGAPVSSGREGHGVERVWGIIGYQIV